MIKVIGYDLEIFTFPSGEPQVRLTQNQKTYGNSFQIEFTYENTSDLVNLALVCDILNRQEGYYGIVLFARYLPFSRQDRAVNDNEAFSLNVFLKMIKGFGITKLVTWDCHSNVAEVICNNIGIKYVNVSQDTMINSNIEYPVSSFKIFKRDSGGNFSVASNEEIGFFCHDRFSIISPDAGASKKSEAIFTTLMKNFPSKEINLVQALKSRDPITGVIKNPKIDTDELHDTAFIFDDICCGSYTFILLADAIKEKKPDIELHLVVTHGIFSKGFEELDKRFASVSYMNKVGNYF